MAEAAAEPDFVESVSETPEAPPQAGEEPAAAPPQTKDDLREAMAELARTVQKREATAAQPTATPEMTPEQKAELWGVWDPQKADPDFFRKWLRLNTDMDPAELERAIREYQPLFAQMQQGLVKQSIIGARNLMQIELARLREELTPMQEFVSSAKAEATRSRFFTRYPSLNNVDDTTGQNRFARVIDATARLLADQTFESEDHYFKALADGAAEAIKGLVPEFDLGAKPPKPAVTSPRLPRTRVGGTGGTAAGVRTPPVKTTDDDSDSLDWGNYGKTA
jgi:hypothetical protein